jgi:hypothetical protein
MGVEKLGSLVENWPSLYMFWNQGLSRVPFNLHFNTENGDLYANNKLLGRNHNLLIQNTELHTEKHFF